MQINDKLKKALKSNKFEPFIRHIRFPYFKTLKPTLRLDFNFPIIAIVGPNGSNKSSILRAISCCPHYQNLGDHWFSTDIDPIDESGGRPRYIFGYQDTHTKKIVEVLQLRIKKPSNPDYWEPSRPSISDGMERLPPLPSGKKIPGRKDTRWEGIKKEVILLDFRSEISAFDKLFYHGDFTGKVRNKKPKDILRKRAEHLKKVIDGDLISYSPFKGKINQVFSNQLLPQKEINEISRIVGRKYVSIRLVHHLLFESQSYTAVMEFGDMQYSEAFAGSGEFAIVMLVHKIMNASPRSLIILDEPEVSLHPGAQIKLMEFISKECLSHKHQIFIGTHSKYIVDDLPSEAIILLQPEPASNRIIAQQNIKPSEAFFHLGLGSL